MGSYDYVTHKAMTLFANTLREKTNVNLSLSFPVDFNWMCDLLNHDSIDMETKYIEGDLLCLKHAA